VSTDRFGDARSNEVLLLLILNIALKSFGGLSSSSLWSQSCDALKRPPKDNPRLDETASAAIRVCKGKGLAARYEGNVKQQ